MSLRLSSIDDVKKLLKQLDVKVTNIEELQGFLESVNASYNPDARRVEVAEFMLTIVPAIGWGVSGLLSLILVVAATAKGASRVLGANDILVVLLIWWGLSSLAVGYVYRKASKDLRFWREQAKLASSGRPHRPASELPSPKREPSDESITGMNDQVREPGVDIPETLSRSEP